MQIDRTKINLMPLALGPLWDQKAVPNHRYASVESLMFQMVLRNDKNGRIQ